MYIRIKRILDFTFALLLLVLLSIPMMITAIAIKVEDGGPVIYKSKRMGKGLKIFNIYKFRSMKTNRKELNSQLTHSEMVTRVGRIIRKTSIDELPQLFNILKGEMSFIGPRPWIPDYYEWFTEEQKKRANVLPGLSGLAQAKGRNGIDIFKKVDYDLEYIEKISLREDIYLIIESVKAAFSKANAEITEQGIKKEIADLKSNKVQLENYNYKQAV